MRTRSEVRLAQADGRSQVWAQQRNINRAIGLPGSFIQVAFPQKRLKTGTRVRVLASHTKEEGTRSGKKKTGEVGYENGQRDIILYFSNAPLITFSLIKIVNLFCILSLSDSSSFLISYSFFKTLFTVW